MKENDEVKELTCKILFDLLHKHYALFEALYPEKEMNMTEAFEESSVSKSTISRLVNKYPKDTFFHTRPEKRTRGIPAINIRLTESMRVLMVAVEAVIKPTKKYDDVIMRLLIRSLKADELSEDIKLSAAHSLKECCSPESVIEGKKVDLESFFIEFLESLEKNKEEESEQIRKKLFQIEIALENFIETKLTDKEDLTWMREQCYPKLESIFDNGDKKKKKHPLEKRKLALKALSGIYKVDGLIGRQNDLIKLLNCRFSDPNEDDGIVSRCREIIWNEADGKGRNAFIDKLFVMTVSEDEKIRERGSKYIEMLVSPSRAVQLG